MTYTTTRYGSRFVRFRSTLARESRARASMAPLDDAFDVEFIDDAVDEAVRDASREGSGGARARRGVRGESGTSTRGERDADARAREARGRARVSQTSRGGEDVRSSRGGGRAAEARARASERMTLAARRRMTAGAAMEEHERAWTSFERRVASEASRPVTLADVPWPRSGRGSFEKVWVMTRTSRARTARWVVASG